MRLRRRLCAWCGERIGGHALMEARPRLPGRPRLTWHLGDDERDSCATADVDRALCDARSIDVIELVARIEARGPGRVSYRNPTRAPAWRGRRAA